MMRPTVRKAALVAHVTSSLGWMGAVAAFLALAVAGLTRGDALQVRAAYVAMEVVAWAIIVPLALLSPLTGIVQSLGTAWGLFRHYWVVAKLVLTIPATLVLLLHLQPIARLAEASASMVPGGDLQALRTQLVANAAAAIVVLLVATILSIHKPRGLTPYGQRVLARGGDVGDVAGVGAATPVWVRIAQVMLALLVLLVLAKHLASRGGMGHGP